MKHDGVVRISLLLTTSIVTLAALYYSRAIVAPVTFALFTIAIAWPLQSTLQNRIPKLLALVVTIVATLAIIAILVFLMVWGFGLVVQWLINNADRLQTLYAQATEWLDSHGVSITITVERIAIHEQKIGKRALFDDADFAWIGIARTGQRQ